METWRLSIERTLLITLLPWKNREKRRKMATGPSGTPPAWRRLVSRRVRRPGGRGLAGERVVGGSHGLGGGGPGGHDRLGLEVARAVAVEPALAQTQPMPEDLFEHLSFHRAHGAV